MTMELVFIRHGAAAGLTDRCYLGQRLDPHLSEWGKRELRKKKARGIYPSAEVVYTSPLSRCAETARVLYPMLVPVALSFLAERDFGSFEGKTYDQLKNDLSYKRFMDSGGTVAPPGGESGREFSLRLGDVLRFISSDAARRNVRKAAVVTHDDCIMYLVSLYHPSAGTGLDIMDFQSENGGGFYIEMDRESLSFLSVKSLE